MNQQLLLDNISRHVPLAPEEQELILSLFKSKKIKRKQFLLQEGDVNKQAAFVLKGCLRSYAIDKNGFEHVVQFAPADWWVSDITSFHSQKPAVLNIDAMYETEVLLISRPDLERLYGSLPKLERYFRIMAERALAAYQQRMINNLSYSAMERYSHFVQLYPSLVELLPQKQIASYIGVTPEFLSKMLHGNGK